MLRIETYGGEDSPVLGGEVAEGFSIELHGGRLYGKLAWARLTGVLQNGFNGCVFNCVQRPKVRAWQQLMIASGASTRYEYLLNQYLAFLAYICKLIH